VFLWDSKSGILLNRLKGDSTIVNSVSGHPSAMSIAVSGLDSQVRIFEPYSLDHEVKNDFEDELSFPSIFMHVSLL
jgi:WD40 repeat protein